MAMQHLSILGGAWTLLQSGFWHASARKTGFSNFERLDASSEEDWTDW